jgi:hypothetical protein
MSTMPSEAQAVWQEALQGKPFIARRPGSEVVADFESWWWVTLAKRWPRPAPDPQVMLHELRQWTGWSTRQTADALGTTHTTVLGVERGRPLLRSRSGDLRQRIVDTHDIVSRLFVLAGRDPRRTADALGAAAPSQRRAIDHLREGAPNAAYLVALDVLQPRAARQGGLLVGSRPARPGTATTPLTD